jgi:hypothetical protein
VVTGQNLSFAEILSSDPNVSIFSNVASIAGLEARDAKTAAPLLCLHRPMPRSKQLIQHFYKSCYHRVG